MENERNSKKMALTHLPLILSNRGRLNKLSGEGLQWLVFTDRDLSNLCLLAISGSLKLYDLYMRWTK